MFSITVTYKDFGGNERTETLRFDLTQEEMLDIRDEDAAFDPANLSRLAEEKDIQMMYKVIRKLILHSYGEVSEDGRYFRKSPQIMSDFAHSAMYRALLEKLLNDESGNLAKEFILNVFPSEIAKQVRAQNPTLTTIK
jgi:hypothetical protein